MKPGILMQLANIVQRSWTTHYDQPFEYTCTLESPCFIDRVLLSTSADTALTSVILTIDGQTVSRHTAETGSTITGHEISLPAGLPGQTLTFTMEAPWSDVSLTQLTIYGVTDDFLYPTPSSAAPVCQAHDKKI